MVILGAVAFRLLAGRVRERDHLFVTEAMKLPLIVRVSVLALLFFGKLRAVIPDVLQRP